jgi:hypothetical protein
MTIMNLAKNRKMDPREIARRLSDVKIDFIELAQRDAMVRHISPDAEQFNSAFGVGSRADQISAIDANGVALAAIKGLYQLVQEAGRLIIEQQIQIDELTSNFDQYVGERVDRDLNK